MDSRGLTRRLDALLGCVGREGRPGDICWKIEAIESVNNAEFRAFVADWFAGCLYARRDLEAVVLDAEAIWTASLKAMRDEVYSRRKRPAATSDQGENGLTAYRHTREREELKLALAPFDGRSTPPEIDGLTLAQVCYSRVFQSRAIEFYIAHTSGAKQPDYALAVSALLLSGEIQRMAGRPEWQLTAGVMTLLSGHDYSPENLQQRVRFFPETHPSIVARNFLDPRRPVEPSAVDSERISPGNSLNAITRDAEQLYPLRPRLSRARRR